MYRPFDRVLIGVEAVERLTDSLRFRQVSEFLGASADTLRNWGRDRSIAEFRHPSNNYYPYQRDVLAEVLRKCANPPAGA